MSGRRSRDWLDSRDAPIVVVWQSRAAAVAKMGTA
jgi:hypothetical protein